MAQLERALRAALTGFAYVGAVGLLVLSLMVSADVALRWATGRPFVGVFEISEVLLVLVTCSAFGLVHLDNRELRVDILSIRAKGKKAAALRVFDAIVGLLVFGLLLWKSSEEFVKAVRGGFLRRGMVEIPTAIPVGFIVVGALCIVVALLFVALRSIRRLAGAEGEPEAPAGSKA